MQEGVQKEAETCVVDARRRLDNALLELSGLIETDDEILSKSSPAELEEAKALLRENPVGDES